MDIVFLCEAISQSVAVFIEPTGKIACDTNIEYRIIPIGKNIDKVQTTYLFREVVPGLGAKILRLLSVAQDDRCGYRPRLSIKMGTSCSQAASQW